MQLHQLKPVHSNKKVKRVGRGGKRGTYSGRGSKGQKSRAGARIRPDFRGGNNPLWKLFPKQRGSTKKVDVKHAKFRIKHEKPTVINIGLLNSIFQEGDSVSVKTLLERGIIKDAKNGVKILGGGELNKRLNFYDVILSKQARDKILKTGGTIR
jgi:large subunit ribosomal protein L15